MDEMKECFITHFSNRSEIKEIDWDTWFDKPGMPIIVPPLSTKLMSAAEALAKRFVLLY